MVLLAFALRVQRNFAETIHGPPALQMPDRDDRMARLSKFKFIARYKFRYTSLLCE